MAVSAHFIFESLAYLVAFRLYLRARQVSGDFLDTTARWNVIAAAIAGAAIGSRVLFLFENPAETWERWNQIAYLTSGKTIVGALLGGTVAVEIVKWRSGIRRRTGDLFAIPIAAGIAIGRIGCLMAGKQDDTYGVPTSLPWGINLGDGVRRHPVQVYEMAAMVALIVVLTRLSWPKFAEGDRFRIFLFTYLAWRLVIDFLKPGITFAGMTSLQWASACGAVWYSKDLWRILKSPLDERKKVAIYG